MVNAGWHLVLFALGWLAVAGQAATPDWFLEAELSPRLTPVQTHATYRLRFFQGVDLRDIKLTGPTLALGEVRPIDNGRVIEMQRGGRRYRVHERHYLLSPYTSGEQTIAGARVDGLFPQGRPLHQEATPLTLNVIPTPPGHRLAAHTLALSEQWDTSLNDHVPLGKAIRREIRIEATGIDAARIPALSFEIQGLSIQAEPAKLDNRIQHDRNIATRTQTFLLTPRQGGTIEIPPLTLLWWRPHDQTSQRATLPPLTLTVAEEPAAGFGASAESTNTPVWLAITLGSAFALFAAVLWRYRIPFRLAWRFERAVRTGNPKAIRDALLALAGHRLATPPPRALGVLAQTLDTPDARQAAAALDRMIYGGNAPPLNRIALNHLARQLLRGIRQQRRFRPK